MRFPYPGEGFFLLRFSGVRDTAAGYSINNSRKSAEMRVKNGEEKEE